MSVSVITVTYNALPALQRTMASVLVQSGTDYEYIIVDGGSKDGTPEFLAEKSIVEYRWISEPDSGIYEAMNKGVKMAQGDFCIFMNAGDWFIDDKVLFKVAPFLDKADILLGNQIHLDEQGIIDGYTSSKGAFTLRNLLQSSVCHQATFIRRSLLLNHPYDESLRLVSDWKFILENFLSGICRFKEIDIDICYFEAGGATDKNTHLGSFERMAVLSAYPQYSSIWQTPYRPSLFQKVRRKTMAYLKKWQYAGNLRH
jgi:glycosyltransferase involved in cell wall biosynthesis